MNSKDPVLCITCVFGPNGIMDCGLPEYGVYDVQSCPEYKRKESECEQP